MSEAEEVTTASWLRDRLLVRVGDNPSYSLRAFARDLGVCHSYLSQIISEKRRLSPLKARQFSVRLALDAEGRSELFSLVSQDHLGEATLPPSPNLFPRPSQRRELALDLDRFRLVAKWYHGAILEFLSITKGRTKPSTIAQRLGLKISTVTAGLKRLERLGLVRKETGVWIPTANDVFVVPDQLELAVRLFHREMLRKAEKELSHIDPTDFEKREYGAMTMAIDVSRLPKAKKRMFEFRKRLMEYLAGEQPTHVYQFNMQLFPLTREKRASSIKRRRSS